MVVSSRPLGALFGAARIMAVLLLTVMLVASARAATPAPKQAEFATPDAAVEAFIGAVRGGDDRRIYEVLGPGSEKLIRSGDHYADLEARKKFLERYDTKHALIAEGADKQVLQVGDNDWPLPIPLLRSGGQWHFDSVAGAQEIVDRRVGQDELAAIRVLLALVDAEHDYFNRTKADDGVGEYAQRVVSQPGLYDGLYWPADPEAGVPESPLAGLVAEAQEHGYPEELLHLQQKFPYQGYYFKLLKGQGPDAPDGARSYIVDGQMTGGFAVLAWPAKPRSSGVMSFLVDQDGVVYQKDLGEDTATVAAGITRFDPDLSWVRVDLEGN